MSLEKLSIVKLMIWKQIFTKIIKENADDPRVENAQRQLDMVNAELESRKDNVKPQNKEDEDGNLTVGLKSIKLTGSSKLG